MKISLILLCVIISYLQISSADVDSEWTDYKEKFNKNYNDEEDVKRKEIFAESLNKVAEHNKNYEDGLTTFTIGINQFSDLTPDERKKLHPAGVVLPNAAKEI